jgi:hypothetical protein
MPSKSAHVPIGTCIFCTKDIGPFTSDEHIVPDSLIGDVIVLQKGFVCDPCNNNRLNPLDEALIQRSHLSFARIVTLDKTKHGKRPRGEFPGFKFKKTGATHVEMNHKSGMPMPLTEVSRGTSGEIKLRAQFEISMDEPMVYRALHKIAYEYLCYEEGAVAVLEQKFDVIRNCVIGESRMAIAPIRMTTVGRLHDPMFLGIKEPNGAIYCDIDIFGTRHELCLSLDEASKGEAVKPTALFTLE